IGCQLSAVNCRAHHRLVFGLYFQHTPDELQYELRGRRPDCDAVFVAVAFDADVHPTPMAGAAGVVWIYRQRSIDMGRRRFVRRCFLVGGLAAASSVIERIPGTTACRAPLSLFSPLACLCPFYCLFSARLFWRLGLDCR